MIHMGKVSVTYYIAKRKKKKQRSYSFINNKRKKGRRIICYCFDLIVLILNICHCMNKKFSFPLGSIHEIQKQSPELHR